MKFICRPRISLEGEEYQGGRKRIFIGLMFASCVAICLCILLFFIIPWLGVTNAWLEAASITFGSLIIVLLAWLCGSLIFHVHTRRNLPGISSVKQILIRLFLPLMEITGKFFGIDKSRVRRSFIKVNNELVLANHPKVAAGNLLLLLPHCVQASSCSIRLDFQPQNCRRCGSCQVGKLLDMQEKYGFRMAIATGGTIARKIVVECKPRLIIAVACERDLASGIQDSYPLPVYGILNRRPQGPCHDTLVPMPFLENVLRQFIE
ncbi:MAG: DUF116 domain-containing protein [Desulfovibrio sp.]|nr:DUF116 domain-containing protein [Desulfovibrio sp.]